MSISRFLKDTAAKSISKVLPLLAWDKRCFEIFQKAGFHVQPNLCHYPSPDTRTLDDKLWEKESELVGLNMNSSGQLNLLNEGFSHFKKEFNFPVEKSTTMHEYDFHLSNLTFGSGGDAEVLHSMIRFFKPKRIIEIGSGFSTYISARACLLNEEKDGVNTKLIAIEPYANDTLKKGFPGLTKLLQKPLEQVDLELFQSLEENDILFIDSTHVLKIGGDVKYEYLDILPRLKEGVIVHSHDIFFPWEYPKSWIRDEHWFWTEQYLLQAFLTFNSEFEILWASYYMAKKYPDMVQAVFPSFQKLSSNEYNKARGASLWIRRKITASVH